MKGRIKGSILKTFWITLTVGIGIFTIYTSVRKISDMRRTKRMSEQVERDIAMYKARIEADSTFIENTKSPDFLESYAREHYNMQREGETVYHINRDTK
ncbi:MAG: septum formation initiator family protein [Alistipes sp.]|nr:septum formation initiator family protein [Alistipes sp.]